jgi:[ribosomal protein S5]-alanine N-acetyltransferase
MPSVVLAPVQRSDATALIRANLASRSHHQPWLHPFTDADGFEQWFGTCLTGATVGLVAREDTCGGIVGVVNISQIVLRDFLSAYLGYYGMAGFTGRGLMTEAVRLAVRHAFDALGLHRVEANVQPGNLRSLALVRRLGFRHEGLSPRYLRIGGAWRDHERWALLADDPAG